MGSNNTIYLVVHIHRPNDVHSVWCKREDAIFVIEQLGIHEWMLNSHCIGMLDDDCKAHFDQCSVVIQQCNSKKKIKCHKK